MAKTPEGIVKDAICEYLTLKNIFFWIHDNVGLYDPTRKVFRRRPKYKRPGVPDLFILIDGDVYGCEVKAPKGRVSPEQKSFGKDLSKHGARWFIARSVQDVIDVITPVPSGDLPDGV